jgi:hypothetical protein
MVALVSVEFYCDDCQARIKIAKSASRYINGSRSSFGLRNRKFCDPRLGVPAGASVCSNPRRYQYSTPTTIQMWVRVSHAIQPRGTSACWRSNSKRPCLREVKTRVAARLLDNRQSSSAVSNLPLSAVVRKHHYVLDLSPGFPPPPSRLSLPERSEAEPGESALWAMTWLVTARLAWQEPAHANSIGHELSTNWARIAAADFGDV